MPSDPTAPPADAPLVAPSAPYQPQLAYQQPSAATPAPAYPSASPTLPQPPPGAAYSGWALPQPSAPQDPDATLRKARTALGWAIGAAVVAALALGLALFALVLAGVAMDEASAGGGTEESEFFESLRGQVPGVTDGTYLPGSDLEHAIEEAFYDYDVTIEDLACPDTKAVTQSMAVVCTADINEYEWSGVVFFEDAEGSFVILEL
jgi:hypothetical protein